MSTIRTEIEAALNHVRQALADATTAEQVAAAGSGLPAIIAGIDSDRDQLNDAIALEATSIDRSKANALRAERSALGDLLTDAESLLRIVSDRHKSVQKLETDAEMLKLQAMAKKTNATAIELILDVVIPLRQLVEMVSRSKDLADELRAINDQLRAADRNELCIRGPLHEVHVHGHQLSALNELLYGAGVHTMKKTLSELEVAASFLRHGGPSR